MKLPRLPVGCSWRQPLGLQDRGRRLRDGDGLLFALAGDSAILVALRVGGLMAAMLATLLLARAMDPVGYGEVVVAIALAQLGGLVCSFNLGAISIRFIPTYLDAGRADELAGFVRFGRRAILLFAVPLSSVVAYCWLIAYHSGERLPSAFWLGIAAMPLFAAIRLESAFVHATGGVVRAAVPGMLLRPMAFLVLVGGLLWFASVPDASEVLAMFLAAVLLTVVLQRLVFRGTVTAAPRLSAYSKRCELDRWISSAATLLVPVLFLEFAIDLIVLLASTVLPPDEVAALGVVMRIQGIVLFGVTSINMASAPRLARAQAAGETGERDRLLRLGAHLKLWPSLLVVSSLSFAGDWLLSLFGDHYADFVGSLVILSMVPLVLAFFGPTVLFVTVLKLGGEARRVFAGAMLALAASIPALGSQFGLEGVAVAVLSVWIGWNLALNRLVKRSAGIDTTPFLVYRGRAG